MPNVDEKSARNSKRNSAESLTTLTLVFLAAPITTEANDMEIIFRDITNEDSWPQFLRYLARVKGFDVEKIIDVCEKSWHWTGEYDQWQKEGMPNG